MHNLVLPHKLLSNELQQRGSVVWSLLEIKRKSKSWGKHYTRKLRNVSTSGSKMNGDLNMQGHAIFNLPEGVRADEPVTNGWYAKNWQDLAINLHGRGSISVLEGKVLPHTDP